MALFNGYSSVIATKHTEETKMKASQMRQLAKAAELFANSDYDKAAKLLHTMIVNCKETSDMFLIDTFACELGFANHPLFERD